jgi:hypothetical protein
VSISKKISATGFYSNIRRDGTSQQEETGDTFISALQFSGLHRNETELSNRKVVSEKNYGAIVSYRSARVDAGLIFNRIIFSQPLFRNTTVYNGFSFRGADQANAGAFLNYSINNVTFFSEFALSLNAGRGIISGAICSLQKNLDMTFVYRKFARDFYTFYPSAFSESTQPQNESGIYWGWKYYWKRKLTLSAYADLFTFPWLGYRRYAPSSGHEWLFRVHYQPNKKWSSFIQFREESKARNQSMETNLYQLDHGTKRNYWVALNCVVNEKLTMSFRVQHSTFTLGSSTTEGLALVQNISYSFGKFQVTGRHAVFETDNYDNRQYVYENDVFMAFSLPAYDGVGVRNYLLLEYKISKKISFWARYARTRFTDRDEIGSGLEMIDGNTRKDIKFQVVIHF